MVFGPTIKIPSFVRPLAVVSASDLVIFRASPAIPDYILIRVAYPCNKQLSWVWELAGGSKNCQKAQQLVVSSEVGGKSSSWQWAQRLAGSTAVDSGCGSWRVPQKLVGSVAVGDGRRSWQDGVGVDIGCRR